MSNEDLGTPAQDFAGRRVFVTGAGSGIGEGIALACAQLR